MRQHRHSQWTSRWAFILATTGSAVGLGNIWKFPYMVGEQGGALFVLIYIACVVLIGVPLLTAEIMMGRCERQNLVDGIKQLSLESGGSGKYWPFFGYSMILGGILILSFYSVIAGWAFAYIFRIGSGMFSGTDAAFSEQVFSDLISDPERLLAWHTVFMALTMMVVARGVRAGLEKAVRILMPSLFVLLLIMVGYAMSAGDFRGAVNYMFRLDIDAVINSGNLRAIILSAVGHAFFTLSLGMGAIMIYGSYLSSNVSIPRVSCIIVFVDLLVALLAGLAIFPLVFAFGFEPGAGPGLLFQTLPLAFGRMPFGTFFGTLFFILVLIAALSSSISLLEPAVNAWMERTNTQRLKTTVLIGGGVWLLGILTVLSFNLWNFGFRFVGQDKTTGIFDILDILTTNIMLPLHGILIALFVGWCMQRKRVREEIKLPDFLFTIWYFVVRFVAPIGVFLVFLHSLGLF